MARWVFLALATVLLVAGLTLTAVVAAPAAAPPPIAALPQQWLEDGLQPPPPLAAGAAPPTAALAAAPDSLAAWSRLVFQSYRDGNWEIYSALGDGSNQTRLTFDPGADIFPRLNRGCTRIAFASNRSGDYEIYTMNPNGSGLLRHTFASGTDSYPAWSPDGTRLAFQTYRDGQAEVYVLRLADNGLSRLTWDSAYDGEPAWSYDGSRIAFTSNRSGDYRIWTMNADGSGQALRSHASYCENPAWKPDGSHVAYDGDANQDGWLELRMVSADGLNDYDLYYPPEAQTDAWARSWSPDGRYLAFTRISWIEQDGTWYWTSAFLDAWDGQFGEHIRLSGSGLDWHPDWQTADIVAPNSSVSALPPYSRGEITVHWGGSDSGGAGIATYDVQMRDGPGGSWTDWRIGTTETSAAFSGPAGHTYFFRSRSVDKAQNREAWPAGDGDASSTFYTWALAGSLRDNRGTPIMGGLVTLTPAPLAVWLSDADGNYSAYEAAVSNVYTATWGREGYGSLPPTALSGLADGVADMVLPPPDNVVLNWGFETGSLEPEWSAGGAIPPGITSDRPHTGGLSAAIGQATAMFDPWVNLSNSTVHSARPSVAADGSGAVHVVWIEFTSESNYVDVLYARREPGGGWSAPVNVSGSQQASQLDWFTLQLAVQADGTAHVAWPCGVPGSEDVFYNRRAPDGTWSGPVNVSQNGHPARGLDMVLGIDGALHLVWEDTSANDDIMYARRASDGTWSAVTNLSQNAGRSDSALVAAGADGTVHAVWSDQTPGNREVFYARRASDGTWSAPLNLTKSPGWSGPGGLAVAADGSVHVAWCDDTVGYPPAVYYALRSAGGTWSDPVQVADPAHGGGGLKVALGPDGSVHLVWGGGSVRYARRAADGMWSPPEEGGSAYGCEWHELRVDSTGTAHTVCSGWLNAYEVLYLRRTADGAWSPWISVSNTAEYSTFPRLALDANEGVHVVWMEGPQYGNMEILYAESGGVEETGESILSQELTVPPEALAPTLSFWYRLDGAPAPGVSWFSAEVYDGQTTTSVFTATSVCDWTRRWVDLSPWADQAVTLRFLVHQTEGQPAAGATLDEVSLGSAYPDLWVAKSASSGSVPPGEPVEFTLTYGNRGGVAAAGVRLTDVLPNALEVVAAQPPPTSLSPLAWDIGALPAGSGPLSVVLTARLAPGEQHLGSLANTATVETTSPELETLNNEALVSVWVGSRLYLPLIARRW